GREVETEEPERTHPSPERLRDLPRRFPLVDVRSHLTLDERAHAASEHRVLGGERACGHACASTRAIITVDSTITPSGQGVAFARHDPWRYARSGPAFLARASSWCQESFQFPDRRALHSLSQSENPTAWE